MKSCALKGQQKIFLLHLNQTASCCRAYPMSLENTNSIDELEHKWQQESQQLEKGVELPGCEICWKDEHQELESHRQRNGQFKNPKNIINLHVDNICNQMCSYCSPKYSSTWQDSIEQHGMFQLISASAQDNLKLDQAKHDPQSWIDRLHDYVKQSADDSIEFNLLGGEPLMQLRNLQNLLTLNLEKISILRITTNLNPPSPKFLLQILDTFPRNKLQIDISIDATPKYNHVPRGRFDLLQFTQNFELLKSHGIDYKFLSVVSVLSIFDLKEFLQWGNEEKVVFNKIDNPDCLDPMYLPPHIKNKILSGLSGLDVPEFIIELLENNAQPVDLKLIEQYNYLKQYFQRAEIVPSLIDNNLFQEYWTWLETLIQENYENLTC